MLRACRVLSFKGSDAAVAAAKVTKMSFSSVDFAEQFEWGDMKGASLRKLADKSKWAANQPPSSWAPLGLGSLDGPAGLSATYSMD